MKQCEHCEWWHRYACFGWFKHGCNLPYPLSNCIANDRSEYVRKWQLGFAWWIPKILLITLALLLGGCVMVKLPDGTEYWRIGPQEIGEVLISKPDGTNFRMERQKAVMPVLIVTPTGFQWGEAREVKP